MYDNPNIPYRCPICLQSVSDCLSDVTTHKKVCGCMTCNCEAPHFTQGSNDSIFVPRVKWDQWVITYRKDHPDWHREAVCGGCDKRNTDCKHYDDNMVNCGEWQCLSMN